ncbi:MAG: cytochrome c biogenesis CcdA family protein [Vicinamibacterales bacterium]
MAENVTLLAAFGAGLLSFVSPCVLPLIPGYLSYISGLSLDEMREASGAPRRQVLLASAAFILGFSIVFIALGASASVIGQFLMERLTLFGKIAGVIIIIFGLHMMGVLRLDVLYQQKQMTTRAKPAGFFGAVLVGIAFAFGWTPCIGPILAGILAVAGAQDTVGEGVRLLGVYSLGLAVPFFATALAVNRFFPAMARIRRHYHTIELVSGALLVAIGVLIFTDRFTVIAQKLTEWGVPVY